MKKKVNVKPWYELHLFSNDNDEQVKNNTIASLMLFSFDFNSARICVECAFLFRKQLIFKSDNRKEVFFIMNILKEEKVNVIVEKYG